MVPRLFFNNDAVASFEQLVDCYGTKEFLSPTRSTIPLLSLLKEKNKDFDELILRTGISSGAEINIEYQVKSPQGRGKASHTDAMIIDGGECLAIEAKWTEPPYETVEAWIKKGPSRKNREAVMTGWLQYLQKQANRTLCLQDFNDVVYQMVHRAASACATGEHPKLLYLHFTPRPDEKTSDPQHLLDGLRHLHKLLGAPMSFPFFLAEMEAQPTDAYKPALSLTKNQPSTASELIMALKAEGNSLFKFTLKELHKI